MEKPGILIPALGGALAAGGCALLLVATIDSYHANLWPGSFSGGHLFERALGLILALSLFVGFPAGLVISFLSIRAFPFTSLVWEAPAAAFTGAICGLAAVYAPAFGHWGITLIAGDFFLLVAGLSVAVGGIANALFLSKNCRAFRSKSI